MIEPGHDVTDAAMESNPRKSLLHVVHSFRRGGLERVLVQVANHLQRRGWDQTICCMSALGPLANEVDPNVPIVNLRRGPNDPRAILAIRRLIQERQVRVVHSLDMSSWMETTAALLGLKRVLQVHSFHGFLSDVPMRWRWIGQWCARRCTALVAVSHPLAMEVAQLFSVPPPRITVIPNGVRIDKADTANQETVADAGHSCAMGEQLTCITVASLKPVKNPPAVVEAVAMVDPRVRFVWLGDGPMRMDMEALARELGVDGRITFVGHVHDVQPWLKEADLFVLSSHREAAPMAVLEAMAAELPVIAPPVGDLVERVGMSRAGIIVPTAAPQHLAAAITKLADDGDLRRCMSFMAREHVARYGSLDHTLDLYDTLFHRCANAGASLTVQDIRPGLRLREVAMAQNR